MVGLSFSRCLRACSIASALYLSALAGAQTVPDKAKDTPKPNPDALSNEQKASIMKGIEEIVTNRVFVPGIDFSKWPAFAEKHKEDIDKADSVPTFTRAVQKTLSDFGITHFRLQTPRVAAARGKTSTVGTGLMLGEDEKGLKVRRVADDSPAKAAGLATGDVIVKINDKKAEKPNELEGDAGAKFKIEVLSAKGESKTLELELKKYSTVRKETLTWEGTDTAILKVYTFAAGYDRQNIEALMTEAAKAKNLILDLRGNGGGATNNLNHLLSLFLKDGTEYGSFISKRVATNYQKENPSGELTAEKIAAWAPNKASTSLRKVPPFAGKVAVLINRGSASASEITTAALREVGGAKVIGTKSAGAVLASVYARLPEGFALQYPVSDYVTIKGVRLEKNPIVPDEEVSGVKGDDGKDPVVEKAVEILRKASSR